MMYLSSDWELDYYHVLQYIMRYGTRRESREGQTMNVGPLMLSAKGPVDWVEVVGRGGKRDFARVEQLCYLAGVDPDPLLKVAPRFDRFREPDGTWWGSYGPRLRGSLLFVSRELRRHPDSRRAVIPLWRHEDLVRASTGGANVPCTVALAFWVEKRTLRLHATMRSCDAWFGLYYDLPAFCMIQEVLSWVLGYEPGACYLTMTSLHVYQPFFERTTQVQPRRVGSVVRLVDELHRSIVWNRSITEAQLWARGQLELNS